MPSEGKKTANGPTSPQATSHSPSSPLATSAGGRPRYPPNRFPSVPRHPPVSPGSPYQPCPSTLQSRVSVSSNPEYPGLPALPLPSQLVLQGPRSPPPQPCPRRRTMVRHRRTFSCRGLTAVVVGTGHFRAEVYITAVYGACVPRDRGFVSLLSDCPAP